MARATNGSTSRVPAVARRPIARCFVSSSKGSIPALEEAARLSPALAQQVGAPGRRSRVHAPAAAAGCATTPRRCGSASARSTHCAACRSATCVARVRDLEARRPRAEDRRRTGARGAQSARSSWSTSASNTSRSAGRRRRSPAARPSASAWPARSAADCAACSTCSTNRRSACIRATTAACSARSRSFATWATRC